MLIRLPAFFAFAIVLVFKNSEVSLAYLFFGSPQKRCVISVCHAWEKQTCKKQIHHETSVIYLQINKKELNFPNFILIILQFMGFVLTL